MSYKTIIRKLRRVRHHLFSNGAPESILDLQDGAIAELERKVLVEGVLAPKGWKPKIFHSAQTRLKKGHIWEVGKLQAPAS